MYVTYSDLGDNQIRIFFVISILKKISAYAIMPVGKKRLQVHLDKRMNPQTVLPYSLGILLVFYSGKEPTRLFVAFVVTV